MTLPAFHLIANTRSGKGIGATLPDLAKRVAAELGVPLIHHPTEDAKQFEAQIDRAVAAAKAEGGTIIAAGGDGTIRSVAQKAADAGVSFGAVACGTFNFFARHHRIPDDPEAALRLAMTGEIRAVRLGRINGLYFLINASLGLYAKSISDREASTKRFGRARLVVILSTMKTLLSRHRNIHVELATDDGALRLRTTSIFVGNNALQLRDLSMDVAHCMSRDLLAVVVLRPVTRWEMLRIFARGVARTIENDERLESFCARSLAIELPMKKITVALDGELFKLKSPLIIESAPEALRMHLPPKVDPS